MIKSMIVARKTAGKRNSLDAIITPCGGGGILSSVAISCKGTGISVFGMEPPFKVEMTVREVLQLESVLRV